MLNTTVSNTSLLKRVAGYSRMLSLVLLAIAFTGTHIPMKLQLGIPQTVIRVDTVLHLGTYMVLTYSFLMSWELTAGLLRPQHYRMAFLVGALYGAMDEITQIPVGRSCSLSDWIGDLVGILLGITLFRLTRPLIYRLITKMSPSA